MTYTPDFSHLGHPSIHRAAVRAQIALMRSQQFSEWTRWHQQTALRARWAEYRASMNLR